MLSTAEQHLLDGLNRIKRGSYDPAFGVCTNLLNGTIRKYESAVVVLFNSILSTSWPKYSGSVLYPIPAPEGFKPQAPSNSSRFYCMDAYGELDKWDVESPYGALRWEAIDFVINFLNQKENEYDESNGTPDAGAA